MDCVNLSEDCYNVAKELLTPITVLQNKIPDILDFFSLQEFNDIDINDLIVMILKFDIPVYYYIGMPSKHDENITIGVYKNAEGNVTEDVNNPNESIVYKILKEPIYNKVKQVYEQYLNLGNFDEYYQRTNTVMKDKV